MKDKKVILYYCKKCSDTTISWRDETFAFTPGRCPKHKITLIPYHAKDILDDIDNVLKELSHD